MAEIVRIGPPINEIAKVVRLDESKVALRLPYDQAAGSKSSIIITSEELLKGVIEKSAATIEEIGNSEDTQFKDIEFD